ncbi:chloramphenicol phosphotransferase CPT [Kribbella sp. NPDC026611]|uniref:chloramphenicol phosphotransferase CPT n=1 Tax=Kribbella sp. NPDC026611 TaxID=3154911 RepID=UPI0033C474D7
MTARLVIVNGGSSSGKTGIVRCLQAVLEEPWLAFSVDDFVAALPTGLDGATAGFEVGAGGAVSVGPEFTRLEAAWRTGLVAMCRAGARVIVDDVFLGGGDSQERWRGVIGDVETLWVGVRCAPEVAAGRELARGDRARGMAAGQALIVHEGVKYDVEVDTSRAESIDCARTIASYVS